MGTGPQKPPTHASVGGVMVTRRWCSGCVARLLTPTPRCRMVRLGVRVRVRAKVRVRVRVRFFVRVRVRARARVRVRGHLQDGQHSGEPIDLSLADHGLPLEHVPG
mgnify:CR=1 FL=1